MTTVKEKAKEALSETQRLNARIKIMNEAVDSWIDKHDEINRVILRKKGRIRVLAYIIIAGTLLWDTTSEMFLFRVFVTAPEFGLFQWAMLVLGFVVFCIGCL